MGDLTNYIDKNGLECQINGNKTYLEVYLSSPAEIVNEESWIKPELTDEDTAVSFVWGADFAAGACIGLISIALIDKCNALIYYMDDQLRYTREMLVADTPQFLNELAKQNSRSSINQEFPKTQSPKPDTKQGFWDKLKNLFK